MQLIQQEGGLLLRRNVNTDGYEFWNFQTTAWEVACLKGQVMFRLTFKGTDNM
jgi:hypothetical protein